MKELLTDIKNRLRAELSYIRRSDIYVTEDIRLIRDEGKYPAVGIKDGGITFSNLSGEQEDDLLQVTCAAYVSLGKPEAMVMGTSNLKGVLDVASDIRTALVDHLFDGIYDWARPVSQGESELLIIEDKAVQMVPVVLEYAKLI